ncbi:hypothetical protein DHD32_22265 [Arenibacter sp. TNZ]|uniref:hypothetical protein n=1 Tax=Arenibacter TaxID=178469 RepID=UPI000CD48775|nr:MULTISPECIES: hypothetical protein [Arenibacter]MCM4174196.1 hypothetical protein [Arenibacter sp. TNZ]
MNKENSKEPKLKKLIGFKPWERRLFWTLVTLIIIAPFVLTRDIGFINFEDTGQIGDTIGGITAPFVNLLAAFLVYKSFSAQIQANQQQRHDHKKQMEQLNKEHSFNYISNYYNLIKVKYERDLNKSGGSTEIFRIINCSEDFVKSNSYRRAINPDNINHENAAIRQATREDQKSLMEQVMSANSYIGLSLSNLLDQIKTLLLFNNESEKSNIDEGIKHFYKLETQKIIKSIQLNELFENRWIQGIDGFKDYLTLENKLSIEKLMLNTKRLTDKGYKLKNQ